MINVSQSTAKLNKSHSILYFHLVLRCVEMRPRRVHTAEQGEWQMFPIFMTIPILIIIMYFKQ